MVELAISDQPQMSLCRLDLDRPGPHYTADLLDLLRALHPPSTQFWFLVGEDSLRDLAKWHAPRRILASCRLAVYPRSVPPVRWENLEGVIPDIQEQIDWLRGPAFACASSKIRRDIQAGRTVEDRLLPAVMAYIEEHGLYRT
jgi:nicotinate-nucleotide adenylyltransferase